MNQTCSNCKYWWDRKICGRIETTDFYKDMPNEGDALIYCYSYDDSGRTMELRTSPTFGCNQWRKGRHEQLNLS